MRKLLFFVAMLCFSAVLFSQNATIVTGAVTDRQTARALAGATVTFKGAYASVVTDGEGRFKIPKPATGQTTLVISYVGYEEKELMLADDNNNVNVALSVDTKPGNEVVVSASRRAEKITVAPASIHVIGKKEFDEFAGSNFGELLSGVQGLEFVRSGVDETMFNARGFNNAFNNKILQMADGRNMMTALSGGLPMLNKGTIIKDDVERLEIPLGPQSALYGPNAQNAVFNFITKDPRKYPGTTLGITAGNKNQFSGHLRHAAKINNRWAFKLTGEYVAGTDFRFYDSVYVPVFPSNRSVPERNVDFDFRHIRGESHLYYSLTTNTDIIVSGGVSTNNYLQVTATTRNQMRGLTYSFLQARITNPNFYANVYNTWGSIGESYQISGYTRDFWNLTNPPNPLVSVDSAERSAIAKNRLKEESRRFNADAQYNHNFQKSGLFFIAGLNYQKESPNGFGINLVDSSQRIAITQHGAVLQLEKRLRWGMRLIGALRWDNHSNFGNVYAPKMGLVKSVADGNLRITWAKAYAMPSILNQYSNLNNSTFGNGAGITYWPNGTSNEFSSYKVTTPLKPEEVKTWEAGYKGTIFKKFYIDVNGYYSRIRNFLGPAIPVGGRALSVGDIAVRQNPANAGVVENGVLKNAAFTTFFNYGDVKAWGVDAGINYRLNNTVSLALKYAWFDSDIKKDNLKNDANRDGQVTADENSANAPNNRVFAMLSFQNLCKQKLAINLSARYVQRYDFYSGVHIGTAAGKGARGVIQTEPPLLPVKRNFNHGALGGFTTFDLRTSYRMNNQAQINIGVTNIFNTEQIEFVASPSIGRLFVFELKLHVPNSK